MGKNENIYSVIKLVWAHWIIIINVCLPTSSVIDIWTVSGKCRTTNETNSKKSISFTVQIMIWGFNVANFPKRTYGILSNQFFPNAI